jgi:glycosyltransferase involved in cell wall biosynthesis
MTTMLTIIVPVYNEQELIAGCLESLLNQTLDKEYFEIIVIDNNSTDLSAKIALDKGVKVEKELRKGYVHAIRKGIEVSQSEFVAFTDADCRVPMDWAAKILSHFSSEEKFVGVGGKVSFYDLPRIINKAFQVILYFNQALPGNNMAVRREAVSQIGGIDPAVNLTVDYWLTLKLRKVGQLKIDKSLLVQTSGRRFKSSFYSNVKYFINVVSMQISSKPLFYDFPDIRD